MRPPLASALRESCGDHDLRGPEDLLLVAVARLVDLHDGAGLGALERLLGHGLVLVGVEDLALGRELLDPDARQRAEQLLLDQPDALGQVMLGVGLLGLGGDQRPVQVVQRRQQLAGQARDAARLRDLDVAARALAHVVGLGRRPQVQVLVVRSVRRLGRGVLRQPGDVLVAGRRLGRLGLGRLGLGRRSLLRRLGLRLVLRAAHYLPSSTTSASTTSSSGEASAVAPLVGAPPSAAEAACCCWAFSYMASETLWKEACSASALALISLGSSLVSTSRTAVIAASISVLDSGSTWSPRSLSWRSAW